MSVHFTRQFPVLPVADVRQAQEYYRDVFQFTIDWCDGDHFGCVSNGEISVFLAKTGGEIPQHLLIWNTDDADRVHEQMVAAGARIVEALETRSWGMREFEVEDLNGHRMRIGHVDESIADYSNFKFESTDSKP